MKLVAVAFFVGLFAFCAVSASAEPITLASGKTIDVISATPGKAANVLTIKYHSALPIADASALRIEADEIWNHFAPDAELGKYNRAILSAIDENNQITQFTLQKANGVWHAIDFEPGKDARLTAELARDFMRRADAAMDHDEMNAGLLYLGDHWTGTSHYQTRGYSSSSIANRTQLAEFTAHQAKNYAHSRDIYNVTIAEDGKTAAVESYETESGVLKGKSFSTFEHSLDNLAIENGSIVIVKSHSDVTVEGIPSFSGRNTQKPGLHLASKTVFLRIISLRLLGVSTAGLAVIFIWLVMISLQLRQLRALVNTGVHANATIASIKTYKANALRGIVNRLNITYQFLAQDGATQHGRMHVSTKDETAHTAGAQIDVIYFAHKPSISALADLMAAKNAALTSSRRMLTILSLVALLSTFASIWYLFK